MAENNQDVLLRAYAMLTSLRKNIGQMTDYSIPETYVREFHTALDRLESIGKDVSEFRIPDSALKPCPTASMYVRGEKIFSGKEESCVKQSFMRLSKNSASQLWAGN